jgi:hypothetical protein
MPRRHITSGNEDLERVFSRNRTLRTTLSPKARKEALNTLQDFKKSGGGITSRELNKSYSKWAQSTKDNITRAQAKIIKRELKEYAEQSSNDKKKDTRGYLDQVRSGNIATSSETHAYLNNGKPPERSGFFRDQNTALPNSFDDEKLNSEREQLF